MIKKIIIIVIADLVLLALFVFFVEKPEPSVAITEILFVPFLFIINLIAGLRFIARRKKEIGYCLLLNTILAPVSFHIIREEWYNYQDYTRYQTFHFHKAGKKYLVIVSKLSDNYDIEEITTSGSTGELSGHYTTENEIFYLKDTSRTITVSNSRITGFPEPTDTMKIDKDGF